MPSYAQLFTRCSLRLTSWPFPAIRCDATAERFRPVQGNGCAHQVDSSQLRCGATPCPRQSLLRISPALLRTHRFATIAFPKRLSASRFESMHITSCAMLVHSSALQGTSSHVPACPPLRDRFNAVPLVSVARLGHAVLIHCASLLGLSTASPRTPSGRCPCRSCATGRCRARRSSSATPRPSARAWGRGT